MILCCVWESLGRFEGVSFCCVWERLVCVWGSVFVLCVGKIGVCLEERVSAV